MLRLRYRMPMFSSTYDEDVVTPYFFPLFYRQTKMLSMFFVLLGDTCVLKVL